MDEQYTEYLNSDVWGKKRLMVLDRDGHKCQLCGNANNLQVHHMIYRRDVPLGKEPISDLVTLCAKCHQDVHRLEKLSRETMRSARSYRLALFNDLALRVISHRELSFGGDISFMFQNRGANFYLQQLKKYIPKNFSSSEKEWMDSNIPNSIQKDFTKRRSEKLYSCWAKTKNEKLLREHGASKKFIEKLKAMEKNGEVPKNMEGSCVVAGAFQQANVYTFYGEQEHGQPRKDVARLRIDFEEGDLNPITGYEFKTLYVEIYGADEINLFAACMERASKLLKNEQKLVKSNDNYTLPKEVTE